MQILVVDSTTESQAMVAHKIRGLNPSELDAMNIDVRLARPSDYLEKISDADILVIGPEVEEFSTQISLRAKDARPDVEILKFVTDASYSTGAFRQAYSSRIRKVFPISASDLDVLQEVVSIYEQFCAVGRKKRGVAIVVAQAKGGVGATTIAAALAEIAAKNGQSALLWDLDIESVDLCRAVDPHYGFSSHVRKWLDGEEEVSREALKQAAHTTPSGVSLLGPPNTLTCRLDLLNTRAGLDLVNRMLELSKSMYNYVIIDTAGKISQTTCALMNESNYNVLVIDDSMLGLTAVDPVISTLSRLIKNTKKFRFVCSGTCLSHEEIRESLPSFDGFEESAWSLPCVPFDPHANKWPGQEKTLYSVGTKSTKRALEGVAAGLGILDSSPFGESADRSSSFNLFGKGIFSRQATS